MIKHEISTRLRQSAWSLFVLASVSACAAPAQAQQFSASIVTRHDDASSLTGRLSVLDGNVRIETTEHPDGFFLVDMAKPSAFFVRPGARLYMEARQSSRLTQLFVPVDPDAPCRQWQVMALVAGLAEKGEWRCERTGEEMIDGRDTVVFRAFSNAGPEYSGWIDRERKFPLRIKTEDGTVVALEQVKDEAQPASSFELPPNLQKFSPEALIEQLRQSDVGVFRPRGEPSRP